MVWGCLTCGVVLCGAYAGHFQEHYERTAHATCLEINEGLVHCAECDRQVPSDAQDFVDDLVTSLKQLQVSAPGNSVFAFYKISQVLTVAVEVTDDDDAVNNRRLRSKRYASADRAATVLEQWRRRMVNRFVSSFQIQF